METLKLVSDQIQLIAIDGTSHVPGTYGDILYMVYLLIWLILQAINHCIVLQYLVNFQYPSMVQAGTHTWGLDPLAHGHFIRIRYFLSILDIHEPATCRLLGGISN